MFIVDSPPALPEQRRVSELAADELRARATRYRAMAATAGPAEVMRSLTKLAVRFETLAADKTPQAQVSEARVSQVLVSEVRVPPGQVSQAPVSRAQGSRAQVSRAQVSRVQVSRAQVPLVRATGRASG